MKNYLFILFVLPLRLFAQSSLDTTFLLPNTHLTTIAAVLVDQDTIVCVGNILNLAGTHGIHFSKYDSTGNLLSYNIIADAGLINDVGETTGFIKTSDGGYAVTSGTNIGQNVLLIKLGHNGQEQWTTEITRPDLEVIYADGLVECNNGYMVAGVGGITNGPTSAFICNTNRHGTIQWNKKYSLSGWGVGFRKIIKKNDNSFWVSGGQGNYGGGCGSTILSKGRTWIMEVDSLGTIKYEWKSAIAESEGAGAVISLVNDTEIVYSTVKIKYNVTYGDTVQLKLRKINLATNQTVWEYYQSPWNLTCFNSEWYGLEQNPVDGGWDMVGSYQSAENGWVISGVCAHTSPEGELQWVRRDTIYTSPEIYIDRNLLRCVAHLSSGSIVAGGYIRKAEPELHDEAWLIKYSIQGCVEAFDCASVGTNTALSVGQTARVYPNPFSSTLMVQLPRLSPAKPTRFILISGLGFPVSEQYLHDLVSNIYFTDLPPGFYFWQIWENDRILQQGKVVHSGN